MFAAVSDFGVKYLITPIPSPPFMAVTPHMDVGFIEHLKKFIHSEKRFINFGHPYLFS